MSIIQEDTVRLIILPLVVLLTFNLYASDVKFSKKASGEPEIIQHGEHKMWCPICGMNLKMFYKTSHAVRLSGGKNKQYCSIRCFLEDYEGLSSIVKEILVVDAKTEKLIDARSATYVVGSKAPGTMSKISKYAFGDPSDAKAFQAKMGGQIMSFSDAADSARKTMEKDVLMTDKKRVKMMYPKGKKIFETACDKTINPFKYNLINELKADIKTNGRCGKLKEKELQAVALYLWDIERRVKHSADFIKVPQGAKCPVCGMFVEKYPKWAAEIKYKNGQVHYFDGVKDMLKFYFNPSRWGDYTMDGMKSMMVTDYYTNRAISAEKAFYVIGSDVYGPMGKEPIPFASRESAEIFLSDHNGREILSFGKINEAMVYKLDE